MSPHRNVPAFAATSAATPAPHVRVAAVAPAAEPSNASAATSTPVLATGAIAGIIVGVVLILGVIVFALLSIHRAARTREMALAEI
ncbi:hypothetical protein SeLEV6574_g05046 [Synchytrium endobioticum]|nr:hypothetical protein SeLEV6574_g05046 [Synchytrium endobioticum]